MHHRFRAAKWAFLGQKITQKKPRTPNLEFVAKNSPARRPKTDRTLKNAKVRGEVSGKNPRQKRTAFPPDINQTNTESQGFSGISRSSSYNSRSERRLEFVIPFTEHKCHQAIQGRRGPKGQKKKKPGAGQNKVRVKRACEGARKRPPSHTKGPGRGASEGPCDPPADKKMPTKSPKRGRP